MIPVVAVAYCSGVVHSICLHCVVAVDVLRVAVDERLRWILPLQISVCHCAGAVHTGGGRRVVRPSRSENAILVKAMLSCPGYQSFSFIAVVEGVCVVCCRRQDSLWNALMCCPPRCNILYTKQ